MNFQIHIDKNLMGVLFGCSPRTGAKRLAEIKDHFKLDRRQAITPTHIAEFHQVDANDVSFCLTFKMQFFIPPSKIVQWEGKCNDSATNITKRIVGKLNKRDRYSISIFDYARYHEWSNFAGIALLVLNFLDAHSNEGVIIEPSNVKPIMGVLNSKEAHNLLCNSGVLQENYSNKYFFADVPGIMETIIEKSEGSDILKEIAISSIDILRNLCNYSEPHTNE